MTGYLFIYNQWPEFAELFATRPITIHEFHSTGMDCLNKTFFGIYFKFIMLCHKSVLIIKCGTDSNIQVLYNEIVIVKKCP